MVSYTLPSSGAFNEQAFMQARPDISNAGLDFNTWYNQYGKNQDVSQFSPYIESGGVQPMTIDPLHQFEQAGYLQMAGQQERPEVQMVSDYLQKIMGQDQINPQAMGYMTSAGEYLKQGAAPIGFNEVEAMRNPYEAALQNRLNEAGKEAQAAILAKQGQRGGASFGNTMFGTRLGRLEGDLASKSADIKYQTYQDALANLMEQRKLQQTAGAQFGNLGTATQGLQTAGTQTGMSAASNLYNLASGATDMQRQRISDMLSAGQGIRGYNQAVLDRVAADILGQQNYEPTQIQTIQSLINPYQSNTGSATQPGANTLQTLGGLGGLAGTAIGQFNNAGQSGMPWQSFGSVNPLGGYYY